MATVIQQQGQRPNAIGRGFGQGISQGIQKLLSDQERQKKETELFSQIAPILGQSADQFGGQEAVSLLSQILSQNPTAIPSVLQGIQSPESIAEAAEARDIKLKQTQANLKKTLAETRKLNREAETAGRQQEKRVVGTVNGRQVFATPDQIIANGGTVGDPSNFQKQAMEFANKNIKVREDIIDQTGQLKPNILSYVPLTTQGGKDISLNRIRSRHYPDTIIRNDQGEILPNPNAPREITKLSNVAERIFQQARKDLMNDKSINTDSIPDSDTLMANVVNHLGSIEERIRSADFGKKESGLTTSDMKLLRLNSTELKAETARFLKNLKLGNTKEPMTEAGGSRTLLERANEAQQSDGRFRIDDKSKQAIFNAMTKAGVNDPKVFAAKLIDRGLPKDQALLLAQEFVKSQQPVQQPVQAQRKNTPQRQGQQSQQGQRIGSRITPELIQQFLQQQGVNQQSQQGVSPQEEQLMRQMLGR